MFLVPLVSSASRPVQAQGPAGVWTVEQCDAQGNPSSSTYGTETGLATNTYPTPMIPQGYFINGFYPGSHGPLPLYHQVGDGVIGIDLPAQSVDAGNCYITGYGWSGTYYGTDASGNFVTGPINGSVTANWSGQIIAYYKEVWQGYGTPTQMPDHIYVLIDTYVSAGASANYGISGLSSGLSAKSTVSDGPPFNETATDSAGDAGTSSGPSLVTGHHLVRAAVNPGTHIAQVSLNGTTNWTATNNVPYMVPSSDPDTPTFNGITDASASGYVEASFELAAAGLNATYINKDLPTNSVYQGLPYPAVVYGGSVRFTSDELLLNAADPNPIPGTSYTWAVYGPGGYTPAGNTPTWNVVISPSPGIVTFECVVQPPDGGIPSVKTLTVEVGIRTDDTILVGWIDATGVTIPSGAAAIAAGVDPQVVYEFAPGLGSGPPGSDPSFPFLPPIATAAIVALAQNDDCADFLSYAPVLTYSQADKDYILAWMFKYAPNPDLTTDLSTLHTTDWTNPNFPPPTLGNPNPVPVNTSSDFTCYAGYMDSLKYQAFVSDPHRFKLLNRFQTKYRVDLTTPTQFNGAPIILQSDALIGATVNPTGIPPDIGPELNFLASLPGTAELNFSWIAAAYANHTLNDPQAGPANGVIGPVPAVTRISQCNDGSPEIPAIRAFNTLMGLDVPNPTFWQNIGSKITFQCGSTAAVGPPITENYPTYYEYVNGIQGFVRPQAATPKGHFFASPYPFGDYPSYGLPPQWPGGLPVLSALGPGFPTIPSGRNGMATTPGDSSSPTPLYTVP